MHAHTYTQSAITLMQLKETWDIFCYQSHRSCKYCCCVWPTFIIGKWIEIEIEIGWFFFILSFFPSKFTGTLIWSMGLRLGKVSFCLRTSQLFICHSITRGGLKQATSCLCCQPPLLWVGTVQQPPGARAWKNDVIPTKCLALTLPQQFWKADYGNGCRSFVPLRLLKRFSMVGFGRWNLGRETCFCLLFYRRKGIAVSTWGGMTHTLRIPADRCTKNMEENKT